MISRREFFAMVSAAAGIASGPIGIPSDEPEMAHVAQLIRATHRALNTCPQLVDSRLWLSERTDEGEW